MIGGFGVSASLTDFQTINGHEIKACFLEALIRIDALSGPFLVSRTGDAG